MVFTGTTEKRQVMAKYQVVLTLDVDLKQTDSPVSWNWVKLVAGQGTEVLEVSVKKGGTLPALPAEQSAEERKAEAKGAGKKKKPAKKSKATPKRKRREEDEDDEEVYIDLDDDEGICEVCGCEEDYCDCDEEEDD